MRMNLTNLRVIHCLLWNGEGWTVKQLSKAVGKSERHVRNILYYLERVKVLVKKAKFGRGEPWLYFLKQKKEVSCFSPLDAQNILYAQPYRSLPKLDSLLQKDYSDLEEELRVMKIEQFCKEAKRMRKRKEKLKWCATVIFARNHIFGREERVSGVLADPSGNLFCGDCSWTHPPKDSILE